MPSPLCVPKGVSCTALTLTCTTLGPTSEAASATGSSAGTREGVWDVACGEASAASWLFPCEACCPCEQLASIAATSAVASATVCFLDLGPNVLEPPVGALGASFATESIRRSRSSGVDGHVGVGWKEVHDRPYQGYAPAWFLGVGSRRASLTFSSSSLR